LNIRYYVGDYSVPSPLYPSLSTGIQKDSKEETDKETSKALDGDEQEGASDSKGEISDMNSVQGVVESADAFWEDVEARLERHHDSQSEDLRILLESLEEERALYESIIHQASATEASLLLECAKMEWGSLLKQMDTASDIAVAKTSLGDVVVSSREAPDPEAAIPTISTNTENAVSKGQSVSFQKLFQPGWGIGHSLTPGATHVDFPIEVADTCIPTTVVPSVASTFEVASEE